MWDGEIDNITHYCVANMPGSVPYTSTIALSNATFKYVKKIADLGIADALKKNKDLLRGLNLYKGSVTHNGLSNAFNYQYTNPKTIITP